MIALGADWDYDLCDSDGRPTTQAEHEDIIRSAGSIRLRSSRTSASTPGLGSASSKAKELLRRASEMVDASAASPTPSRAGHLSARDSADARRRPVTDHVDAVIVEEADDVDAAMVVDNIAQEWQEGSILKTQGILGSTTLPSASDPAVVRCTSKAPQLRTTFSFRASARGGLVALPMVNRENGGSFRIKLLRLKPGLLSVPLGQEHEAEACLSDGINLLEAHKAVSFTTPPSAAPSLCASSLSVPSLLMPLPEHGAALLAEYLEKGKACLGVHAYETFELLSALLGDCPGQADREDVATLANASHRFGVWLAKVNSRTVSKHLTQPGSRVTPAMEMAVPDADNISHRLKTTFHCLTANSVRCALQELNKASSSSAGDDARDSHFDRLATILASCGGTASGGSVERRQWLKRQVLQWKHQNVDELMGPALWRIYSLLAGDVDNVAADALDWRTTFGMYLWYRSDDEKNGNLLGAVRDFEVICRKHGANCNFRPAPPYVRAKPRRDPPRTTASSAVLGLQDVSSDANAISCDAAYDLQFSVVRAALGLVDWSDLDQFDYMTYSPRPMDVAGAWHFCLLLLALSQPESRSEATSKAFQQLTQHYALSLELAGHWEWAAYVALFVSDDRARASLVRDCFQRNSATSGGLALPVRPQWSRLPSTWIWRSEALRRERSWEWPAAVACWLKHLSEAAAGRSEASGATVERAVSIAVGFLVVPALVKHRQSQPPSAALGKPRLAACGLEATTLATMSGPASWLLAVFSELEPQLLRSEDTWARVGRDTLAFMRDWSQAGSASCTPERLARLSKQCSTVREQGLGLPW